MNVQQKCHGFIAKRVDIRTPLSCEPLELETSLVLIDDCRGFMHPDKADDVRYRNPNR